jgi:two-component system nitrogen regulation response regulator GlnG
VPVLLRGETGTGKELVARALHARGPRRRGPFVSVNLGAIPRELAAAELFGAVRGAYTGAARDRDGYFRAARGGTLFLDEVAEAPPEVQVTLLRVLETGELYPVGGDAPIATDVRVIAATDADLDAQIRDGRFKAPLLHRLAGSELHLPPLRERAEDLPALCAALLESIAAAARLPVPALAPDFAAALARWPWRGNVRELRAVLENAVLWWDGTGALERAHLAEALVAGSAALAPGGQALAERMLDAWRRHGWNQEAARRELGLTRGEWRRRFARLGLDVARRGRP